jgi:hypothetical protein
MPEHLVQRSRTQDTLHAKPRSVSTQHAALFMAALRIDNAILSAGLWRQLTRVNELDWLPWGALELLDHGLGFKATPGISDGIVPTLSQVHGRLLHVARADHLDMVGHYTLASGRTGDWLPSGAGFTPAAFGATWEAVAARSQDAAELLEPPTSLEACKVVRKGAPCECPSESGGSKWERPISSRPLS